MAVGRIDFKNVVRPTEDKPIAKRDSVTERYFDDNNDSKVDRRIEMSSYKYTKEDYNYDDYGTLTNSKAKSFLVNNGEIGLLSSIVDKEYYQCGAIKSQLETHYLGGENSPNNLKILSIYNELTDLLSETYEYNRDGKTHKGKSEYEYYPDGTLKQETYSGHQIDCYDCKGVIEKLDQYDENSRHTYSRLFVDSNENGNYEKAIETYYNEDGSEIIREYSGSDTDGILSCCYERIYDDKDLQSATLYVYDKEGNITQTIDQMPARAENEQESKGLFSFLKGFFGNS